MQQQIIHNNYNVRTNKRKKPKSLATTTDTITSRSTTNVAKQANLDNAM